jgi:hypothetical protein
MGFLENPLVLGSNANLAASSAILGLFIIFLSTWLKAPEIPVVNNYRWDFFRKKAHTEFGMDARALLARGFKTVYFMNPDI